LASAFAVARAPETRLNCVAPGLLEGTRATANLRPEQIERSTANSVLKQAADKDDCAEMVVTMCRSDTMTPVKQSSSTLAASSTERARGFREDRNSSRRCVAAIARRGCRTPTQAS
jgi:hypothetical protein